MTSDLISPSDALNSLDLPDTAVDAVAPEGRDCRVEDNSKAISHDWKLETIAAQGGGIIDAATGAIVPPVHVATTFVRDADNQYRRGYCYGRSDNATVRQAEHVLSELEDGSATLLFGSGMAAATSTFLALPRPAHVIAPNVMYWGLRQWLTDDAPKYGIETSFVDAGDTAALSAAMRQGHTRLVWIETPSNPMWTLTDIADVVRVAHAAGVLVALTPLCLRPC